MNIESTESRISVTVAIPTYRRDQVLVDTVRDLLALDPPPAEILVLDQTPEHTPEVAAALRDWDTAGHIRWLRLPEPSIPRAINRGLLDARHAISLVPRRRHHPRTGAGGGPCLATTSLRC